MLQIDPGLKEELLHRIEKRSHETPAKGGVIKVKSRAIHHLQTKAEADGFAFVSDEGERVGGFGAGPAPLRYFLAGVLMCHQVWCIKSAALLDVRIDSLKGSINGHLSTMGSYTKEDADSSFEKLSYEIDMESPDSSEQIAATVKKACRRCPAFGTVKLAVPIEMIVNHNGKKILETRFSPGKG